MVRVSRCLALAVFSVLLVASGTQARDSVRSVQVGGFPAALVAGDGSLWVLTCDRGCSGEARHSMGRIVRIDPRRGRVVAWRTLPRPHALAAGAAGLYANDFWRGTIRRIAPRTLRLTRALKLHLPFRFTPRDNAFLPFAVAVGPTGVWIATERGALARADLDLRHVVGTVRLPFDALGGLAVGPGAVWLGESLAGVYRIDSGSNRIVARIRIPQAKNRFDAGFDAGQVFVFQQTVLVVGAVTRAGVLTDHNRLARIDSRHNWLLGITPLPSGPLTATLGEGWLWVGRMGGSGVERIDPRTGLVVARVPAGVGIMLAVADGHLWTVSSDGNVRRLNP